MRKRVAQIFFVDNRLIKHLIIKAAQGQRIVHFCTRHKERDLSAKLRMKKTHGIKSSRGGGGKKNREGENQIWAQREKRQSQKAFYLGLRWENKRQEQVIKIRK